MATNPQVVPNPQIPNAGAGTLFVFLHGMICLVETPDQYLGLVVDMGQDHSYRMGDWLTELPFARGSVFSLQGVEAAAASLDATKISVIDRPLFPSPRVFATMRFPKPRAIHSLRRTPVAIANLTGAGVAQVSQPQLNTIVIAGLQVLEYDFADLKLVNLPPSDWAPTLVNGKATLHFYAEPESPKPPQHQVDEFQRTAGLFLDLDLSTTQTFLTAPLETAEYPAGIPTAEAMGLMERQPILRGFALSVKEGTPGMLPVPVISGGDVLCAALAAKTGR